MIACTHAYSPNAEEALSLLADPSPVSKSSIEQACKSFLDFGVGPEGTGAVVIRSGSLGAYVASRSQPGTWIEAYWRTEERVVDVTGDFLFPPNGRTSDALCGATGLSSPHASLRDQGAGNSFLGGLAAGLVLTNGDVFEGKRWPQYYITNALTRTNVGPPSAALYGTVSASYTVEQLGLPQITRASDDVRSEEWNGDSPWRRLQELKARGIQTTEGGK